MQVGGNRVLKVKRDYDLVIGRGMIVIQWRYVVEGDAVASNLRMEVD